MTSCSDCLYNHIDSVSKFLGYSVDGTEPNTYCWLTQGLSFITSLALFIIGYAALTGAFPGAALPWVTVGLGGGGFLLTLALGDFQTRRFVLISRALMAASLIILGVLGGVSVLSTAEVAFGIIGTTIAAFGISYCMEKRRQKYPYERVSP